MNDIDNKFNVLVKEINKKTKEEVFEHIKSVFLLQSVGNQNGLISYFKRFNYWGSLDRDNNDYESFELRSNSLKDHLDDYVWLYEKLEDYRSKQVLYAVLNNWYNFDYNSLNRCKEVNYKQYFDLDIVKCDKNEVIVDLGAYIGDTIKDYINEYGIGNYKQIFCYEISPDVFRTLKLSLSKYTHIKCIQKAVSDKKGIVYISRNENSSSANSIVNKGEEEVEAVSIDDDIKEKITLLKMDIEGAEKKAIKGASKHIKNDKPKLLISVYHNYEDLYEIPKMINKLNKNYKYYLRFYGGSLFPTEIVLLAINKD